MARFGSRLYAADNFLWMNKCISNQSTGSDLAAKKKVEFCPRAHLDALLPTTALAGGPGEGGRGSVSEWVTGEYGVSALHLTHTLALVQWSQVPRVIVGLFTSRRIR